MYTLKVPRYRFTGQTSATIFNVSSNRTNTGGAGKGNRTLILGVEVPYTNRCAIPANNTVKLVYTENNQYLLWPEACFTLYVKVYG